MGMMHRRPGRVAVLLVAAVLLPTVASACSIPDQGSAKVIKGALPPSQPSAVPKPATPTSTRLVVYFVNSNGQLVPVQRADPYGGLGVAVEALIAGPTSHEQSAGLTTAVPTGTKLDGAGTSGSTASLDFTSSLASVSGHEQLLAFAQIVETASAIPGVRQVQISVAGQAVNAPQPDGTLAQGPVTGTDYSSLLRP